MGGQIKTIHDMQIVTTFFNNEKYYMDNFIHWYRKLWGADRFIFFIGKSSLDSFNWEKNEISFLVTERPGFVTYEYKSGDNSADQWNAFKAVFYEIIKCNHTVYPSMWLDCDEFIYTKDINKALKDTYIKTHYYEYVPNKPFSLNSDSLWSVCPYYYTEQSRLFKRIITKLLHIKKVPHRLCASRSFNPLLQGGHMGSNNGYCNTKFKYDDYLNVCFHVGVHSKEHYLTSKHWLQTHSDGIGITQNDRQSDNLLAEIFDKYHAKCEFETFTLNLHERYKL